MSWPWSKVTAERLAGRMGSDFCSLPAKSPLPSLPAQFKDVDDDEEKKNVLQPELIDSNGELPHSLTAQESCGPSHDKEAHVQVKLKYSQEEIDAWIAERKRNWPSRANVARKTKHRGLALTEQKTDSEKEEKGALGILEAYGGASSASSVEDSGARDKRVQSSSPASLKRRRSSHSWETCNHRDPHENYSRPINHRKPRAKVNPSLHRVLMEQQARAERQLLLAALRHLHDINVKP
mmetsp:Transcript_5343/g.10996  ORF Transcript_5343/g.10996 Transcript_5343/m.10996 type:complete len:237 (-) Transcript_5343:1820-2530(-)